MNCSLRIAYLPAAAACLAMVVRLSGADTPPAQPTTAAPSATAAAPAPTSAAALPPHNQPLPPALPRSLDGIVTQDEFTAFVKFQQSLREDPEIKELNGQIRAKMIEMSELQKKVQLAQQRAIEAHPDIKAIADKIAKSRQRPQPFPAAQAAHATAAPAAAATAAPTAAPK
jgi:hypothetical protein